MTEKMIIQINNKIEKEKKDMFNTLAMLLKTKEINYTLSVEKIKTYIHIVDGIIIKDDEEAIKYLSLFKTKYNFSKLNPPSSMTHMSNFVPNYARPIQVSGIMPHGEDKDYIHSRQETTYRRLEGERFTAMQSLKTLYNNKPKNSIGHEYKNRPFILKQHQEEDKNRSEYKVVRLNKGSVYESRTTLNREAELGYIKSFDYKDRSLY